ncbi:adenylate kinase [Thermocaproicibacter melissae]|uniref:adenylate kinase n=1 Tax=Thermocaproicibacter melissae TaxID=2966552 RepID=UPI0024B0A3ED|nr:adenylate kinase [Thermocaproicibacter melissae]WBY65074.1 adenylate kinase [Thermocaproicibacter melissae]
MNLIFLGAPGAGKGTHAEILSKDVGIPQISTGNIIREALKSGTEMGLKAKSYIEAGKLVPDDVVIGIIRDRLAQDDCANGFILDGFPRTIPQAEALDKMVRIDRVINLDVPESLILRRLSGRRVCSNCGASYNVDTRPPKKEGICDVCGGTLVQRKDDNPETVRERLKVYHEQTEPLVDYYEKQGKLRTVHGTDDTDSTARDIKNALEA